MENRKIINKPRRTMYRAIITGLALIGVAVIGGSSIDGMKGGYALIFISGFAALSAFITAAVFHPRAREFDRLLDELQPLAHWKYTDAEWEAFIREDLREVKMVNRATLKLVLIISAVVCLLLVIIYRDTLFILIVAGIMLLLTAVGSLAPYFRSRVLRKGVHEAIIGEKSVMIGGSFQLWTQLGAHLTGVDIYTDAPIPVLHIIFEYPTLQTSQEEIIRVPVPDGKMEEAARVVEQLRKQII
ncbi:MAG: hypothetical protein IAE96_02345 [Chitinophagaceae bacterium]|nr:hypothetical protein [Chitinophagaceae bacterium]